MPGDIVRLRSGDVVPADCRLLEATGVGGAGPSLTGGPLPVPKDPAPVVAAGLAELAAEDLTDSYPPTLRHWRANFRASRPRLAALGYDQRFRRLWELYLCWSEGGFLERRIEDHQLLLRRVKMRLEPASSSHAGPRDASLASASLPPGPSTASSDRIAATTLPAHADAG